MKITNDDPYGRGKNTRVISDSGEDISNYVTKVVITIVPNGLVEAEVTLKKVSLSLDNVHIRGNHLKKMINSMINKLRSNKLWQR